MSRLPIRIKLTLVFDDQDAHEMLFKLERGVDALRELLDDHGIADVLDRSRPSVAPKQRGFFGR